MNVVNGSRHCLASLQGSTLPHMKKLELPLLNADAPLSDAFRVMLERDLSGVVVRHSNEYRLLHVDDLRRALARSKRLAGAADSFTPLAASRSGNAWQKMAGK